MTATSARNKAAKRNRSGDRHESGRRVSIVSGDSAPGRMSIKAAPLPGGSARSRLPSPLPGTSVPEPGREPTVRIKAGKAPQRRSRARENLSGRFATLFGPLTAAIGLQTLLVIHTTLGANLVQVLAALTFGFGMAVMARYKLDAAFAASAQDRAFRHLAVTGSLLVVAMILLACHLVGTVWPITAMAVLSGQIGTLIGTTHSSLGYSAETLAVRPDEARLMGRAALLPSLLAALAIMFATSMMPAAAIFVACAAALVVSVRFPDAIADLFD